MRTNEQILSSYKDGMMKREKVPLLFNEEDVLILMNLAELEWLKDESKEEE
jgi:hypothetical protein